MNKTKMTPAKTDEGHERKLITLAYKQAQTEMEAGKASSQVVTHFLKLGSIRAQAELKKLELEARLLEEKIQSERNSQQLSEMFATVLEALKSYSHQPPRDADVDIF